VALLAGCSPGASTIGGWDGAALKARAEDATVACRVRTGRTPPAPFTTDGCSLSPDGSWQTCCVDHDAVYWCGGSADERERADRALKTCVADTGGPTTAALYYYAVRAAGGAWMPLPWRWGYGWPWPYRDARR